MTIATRALYAPFLAQVVVTRRCNLRCAYCDEYDTTSAPVPLADLLERLGHLKRLGAFAVEFTGGEPLLNPGLIDAIAAATRLGFLRRMLITNASLLTADRVAGLGHAGLTDVQVSLDGVEPNGSTSKVLRLRRRELQLLAGAPFRVTLSTVLGSVPMDEVTAVVQFARDNGFTPRVIPWHDAQGRSQITRAEADRLASSLESAGVTGARSLCRGLLVPLAPFRCRAGARYLYVNEHGDIQWCSRTADLFARSLASYGPDDLRAQFHGGKPCSAGCSIRCARNASRLDAWRPQHHPAQRPVTR